MKKVILILVLIVCCLTGFPQQDTLKDSRDGKIYKTIKIGTQTWMAENLNYKTTDSWCNQCETYGRLYTYASALNACPYGWHLPSDTEWTTLTDYLGGEKTAGSKLKETGNTHWFKLNKDATNETSFTALPAGVRDLDGTFNSIGNYGYWWCSTNNIFGRNEAWSRAILDGSSQVCRYVIDIQFGKSVRCIKN